MLSFEEYNKATLDLRYDEVFSKGELLDTFFSENYKVALYSYNHFIIEVLYRLEIDTVKDLLAITIMEAADKYVSLKGRLDVN
jgi:hypothetical protein